MSGLLQAVCDPPALHCGPDYFKEPKRISALGPSHVGYSIPSDLVGVCVTGCVDSRSQQSAERLRRKAGGAG